MLQGTLDAFDLGDVLALLEMGKKTGALEVESDEGRGVLFLVDGRFGGIGADDADPLPPTPDEFEAILVDACAALINLEVGVFRFVDGRTPSEAPRDLIEIGPIVARAREAADEWRQLEDLVPSLDAPVLMVPELPRSSITIDHDAWRVLAAVDGERSVRDLANDLARPMLEVGRYVAELFDAGAVAFFEPAADPALIERDQARVQRLRSERQSRPSAFTDAPASTAPTVPAGPIGNSPGPDPRSPRSVGELAAWADSSPGSRVAAPADPYAAIAAPDLAPEYEGSPDGPDTEHRGNGARAYAFDSGTGTAEHTGTGEDPGAGEDPGTGEDPGAGEDPGDDEDDDARRDRGALLRMFSALKD